MAFCMKCIGWGLMGEMYGFLYEMYRLGPHGGNVWLSV